MSRSTMLDVINLSIERIKYEIKANNQKLKELNRTLNQNEKKQNVSDEEKDAMIKMVGCRFLLEIKSIQLKEELTGLNKIKKIYLL